MFIQYFGHVGRALGDVEELLPDVLGRLDGWGKGSYRMGEELRTRIGLHRQGGPLAAKTVTLQVGEPSRGEGAIRIPLSWEATGTPGLFPKMTADLVLADLGDRLTLVKFEGRYEPPLGTVGELLDRALLHRVSEVSVKNLVDHIVGALEAAVTDPSRAL
jgi:hypothetical protein